MFVKSAITAAFLVTSLATASAQTINVPAGAYVSDPNHTNLLWSVQHFGLSNYYGRFDSVNATLELEPQNLARSKLHVTIDPKSVDTNYQGAAKQFQCRNRRTEVF